MIRRPPRSTLDRSSAASDVYKRQVATFGEDVDQHRQRLGVMEELVLGIDVRATGNGTVSYTHLRAHETVLDLVCRLLLEKKKLTTTNISLHMKRQDIIKQITYTQTT